jgi:hypothetical protein
MGGYLSGGWNKTHGSTASTARLDSFELRDKLLNKKHGYLKINTASSDIAAEHVFWTQVNNNFDTSGNKPRIYFVCPACGRRARFMYYKPTWGRLLCRECGRLHYPIQQVAKGTMRHEEQMRTALRMLKYVEAETLSPIDLYDLYQIPRPRYMHKSIYQKHMSKFHVARIKWHKAYISESMAILGRSTARFDLCNL